MKSGIESILASKAKEIWISIFEYWVDKNPEGLAPEIFDKWLRTKQAAALLSGEDWISVKDRLPEIQPKYYDKDAEAYLTPCNVSVLVWDGEYVYEKSFGIIDWDKDITHWQPLPEPPKP